MPLSIGLVRPGQPTLQFANVVGLPGSTLDEIVFSGITLVGDSLGFNDLLQRTHGQNFYDNTGTVYSGSADDIALNTGVQRFSATPAGLTYIAKYYTPTGQLRIPMLTLHTTQDPAVSFSQEHAYADTVAAAGGSQFRERHCGRAIG